MSEYYPPDIHCAGLIPIKEELVTVPSATTVQPFANAPSGTAAVLFTFSSNATTTVPLFTFLGTNPSHPNVGHAITSSGFIGRCTGFLHMEAKYLRLVKLRHNDDVGHALWITYFGYRKETAGA